MIGMCKTKLRLNEIFMTHVFTKRNDHYNLRNENHLQLLAAKTKLTDLKILNAEAVFCDPNQHKKLRTPKLYLNSNGQ